ncbi:MAG: 3-deoxy-D-manno-octulosonic acid transferase [Gammaproteobacteria bacterium]|nr:3-deoxy-D-manno-octulosonic acid transferase [Gammaproteobacteria bacterium]MBT4494033.1 3-deoxy-D-manno-octulosonic acid transferase [Gammaproteobacteria bacterium]
MYRFLYSCAFYLAIPFVLLRLVKRSIKEPDYRRDLGQRFGFFRSRRPGEVIWIHAVSAGETVAAAPLIKRLLIAGYPCLVTNMTPTGRERARVLLGDAVENCYAPYDIPDAINRFLSRNRPRLFITIDTELWPNMLAACERDGIPAAVINGRMAARSAEGYSRISVLTVPMMRSLDLIAAQTEPHAKRFIELGAESDKVKVTGSIKFDGQYSAGHEARLASARQLTTGRPVILGASTHEGEEEALLSVMDSLAAVVPDALLVLAPRHTHRTDHVARVCASMGYPARRFSEGVPVTADDSVLMLDVMGELESYFPIARVAYIGGSLVPVGGHNLLEAVRAGTAVIMGPHLDNVEDITQQFIDHGAMLIARDRKELKDEVIGLMRDEGRTRLLVAAASEVLERNRGSIERAEQLLIGLIAR